MKAVLILVVLIMCSACNDSRMEATMRDGAIYLRTEFGKDQFLIRKIYLSYGGNGVVNFAGSRLVSSVADMPFDQGHLVSRENDDVPPIKINGEYIGGNHGLAGKRADGSYMQIYPAISGKHVDIDAGTNLGSDWVWIDELVITEKYTVNSPVGKVGISHRYSFIGNMTNVRTQIDVGAEISNLIVMPVQAGPLNSEGSKLLQRVKGSVEYDSWKELPTVYPAKSVAISGMPAMAQSVKRDDKKYMLEIGSDDVPTLNGVEVHMPGFVDISAHRKQYVPVYAGPARRGDVIEVSGYRRYYN